MVLSNADDDNCEHNYETGKSCNNNHFEVFLLFLLPILTEMCVGKINVMIYVPSRPLFSDPCLTKFYISTLGHKIITVIKR